MRFLTHRFVLILAGVGLGVSLLLGFFSGVHVMTMFVRALLSAVGMGGFGFLFLFVLEKVLAPADFEELMALLEGKTSSSLTVSQKNGEDGLPSEGDNMGEAVTGATVNVVEDSESWDGFVEEKEINTARSMASEEEITTLSSRVFDPAMAVEGDSSLDAELKEFSPSSASSSSSDYREVRAEHEREKPSHADNKVSFMVNDKKVNTSPEVVAKAIKTILSRDS